MKQSIGLVSLVVREYDEAIAFYVGTLGFALVEDTYVPEQDKRWVVVALPGAIESRLLLARASNGAQAERIGNQTGGRVFLFLYTDDFARDYAAYKAKGVEFVRPQKEEPYGTVAVFKDLYGNLWDLVQLKSSQPAASAGAADITNRLLEAWNARDLDKFVALLSEDVEWYDPGMADPPARGRAAVKEFAQSMLEAFPDFKYEVDGPMCVAPDGSRCAIVWRITATHQNPMRPMGYAPTGRRASFEGVDVLDIRDGAITRIRTAFDPMLAAEQLLGMKLRPVPGTLRGTIAVVAQRFLAWISRGRK